MVHFCNVSQTNVFNCSFVYFSNYAHVVEGKIAEFGFSRYLVKVLQQDAVT